jgi:hypothetical protein
MAAVKKAESKTSAAKEQPKMVFISAPVTIDTRPVRKAFEARGMNVFSLDQIEGPGRSVIDIIKEGLGKADLVVAVVDPSSALSNFVFFEMGYAVNMGKPTAVLLTGEDVSPFWVNTGIPYFRYSPEHPIGTDFVVQQILSIPHHKPAQAVQVKQTKPLGDKVQQYLDYLDQAGRTMSEEDLLTLIRGAIRESGVPSVAGEREFHKLDLAVWSDDFIPWVGNPVAIELKVELPSGSDVSKATKIMDEQMMRGNITFGLLIYLRSGVDVESMISAPWIAAISVKNLFERLRTSSFGDIVRQLRNQRVHGAP